MSPALGGEQENRNSSQPCCSVDSTRLCAGIDEVAPASGLTKPSIYQTASKDALLAAVLGAQQEQALNGASIRRRAGRRTGGICCRGGNGKRLAELATGR